MKPSRSASAWRAKVLESTGSNNAIWGISTPRGVGAVLVCAAALVTAHSAPYSSAALVREVSLRSSKSMKHLK